MDPNIGVWIVVAKRPTGEKWCLVDIYRGRGVAVEQLMKWLGSPVVVYGLLVW
jgi:hypothetical protein